MSTTLAPSATDTARDRGPSFLRTVGRLGWSELRVLAREPVVLVGLVAFPAITALVIAGSFGSEPDPDFGDVIPSSHYVVGYVGVVLAQLGLVTLPVHIAAHRERGVLRRFRSAGVGGGELAASQLTLGVALGVIAAALVLAVGALVYDVPAPADPAGTIAWFGLGLACFTSLGIALGLAMPGSRAASAIGNLVFFPMFLLGGGGPPPAAMPAGMRSVSEALPLTHIVGGLRLSWLGDTEDAHVWWWPALVTVIAVLAVAMLTRRRLD